MTPARHRAAALTLRSRFRAVTRFQMSQAPSSEPAWGCVIWPALADEHELRAILIERELASTIETIAMAEG